MKVKFSNKGFTLVEILISLAILGIIVSAFVGLFGTGFANIFSIGNKDLAMAEASEVFEILYRELENERLTKGKIEEILDNQNVADYEISEYKTIFSNGDPKGGYEVTITIVYQGDREVSLTSFIRGSDE